MRIKLLAVSALFATILFWGFFAVIARFAVFSVSPMVLLFIRFFIGAVCFLPFFLKDKPWKNKRFRELLFVSSFSTINVALFIWGIQYTSASASQVIYAVQPVLILLFNFFVLKEKHPLVKVLGVAIGFAGVAYIVYLSAIEKGTTISGNLVGNLAILGAMGGWLTYILTSKKISKHFTPMEIGSTSIFVTLFIATFLVGVELFTGNAKITISLTIVLIGLYMGIFATFLAYICTQFAVKHLSPLTTSLSSYIQPIATAIFATLLIGERVTANFLAGSMFVFAGIFLTSTVDAYTHRKRKHLEDISKTL
ncbi:DMT family transporter [Candidatus Gottesmanbacteria bacterium]|nr:DMT family transporter [Candidatus Gottesmanbacteria bacterium]